MSATIDIMGHFTAIGMRTPTPHGAVVIDTCAGNDTSTIGDDLRWAWSNPTNRAIEHVYEGARAVSVEAMWQATKVFEDGGRPDPATLAGDWRRGKAKRPIGAWAGDGQPLITSPGEARRRIYLPAFARLVDHWLRVAAVRERVSRARRHDGPIFLRDWDTGRGVDRNGPMSHAWVLASWLNALDVWSIDRALAHFAPSPAQLALV